MCFGNMTTTEQKSTTNALPTALSNAATTNLSNAANVTNRPFTPYTGELTAPQTADENTAAGMLRTVAGSSNPYSSDIASLYRQFANTPGGNVSLPSILGANIDPNTASLSDYMNPYTSQVLNPQLADIDRQSAAQAKQLAAQATFGGAFGDARHGIEAAKQVYDTNRLRADTIGQAYNNAFTTAAGLRSNDLSNLFNVQNTNNANRETALNRGATGATDLLNLDKYDTGRTTDLAQALAQSGATARGANQQADTAKLTEFMRQQNWDPQMISLMTQILGASPLSKELTTNSTTQAPDNTGYSLLGALIGAGGQAAKAFAGGK